MVPTRETVIRNLWASPGLFVTAALCASHKESPGPGGAFALVALLGFGLLFWLNHA
ncbi:hypothetical protein [Streptomyces sp. NPDC098101]|uniref:hypothetical protein n=1 Tax=Streptomyces sp. NPDC098101 TaxID=3366096 RepID=UPI003827048E